MSESIEKFCAKSQVFCTSLTLILYNKNASVGVQGVFPFVHRRFHASDDSFYVTGQTLTMDGGLTCHEPQWKEDLENFEKELR